MSKKKVLILNGQYLPGYKGGGPIRSCVNMVENLSDEFEFYILCADRDFKDCNPYEGIEVDQWNDVGSAKVFYMSPKRQSLKGFKEILNRTNYDILYLNGFFSPIFTIKPLLLLKLRQVMKSKVILTPRGDFTGGCENKKIKKYTYIYLSKLIGLYKNLIWHATSDLEEKDIKKKFKNAKVFNVPNLSAKYSPKKLFLEKKEKELRLVFISRIFPKKNLKFALEVLSEINEGDIIFDIYGPMEDKEYWHECEKVINKMPANIKVEYRGEIEHKEIENTFSKYHAFLFPTLGENYGHVIIESLMAGCLLLISDTTPWKDLEESGIGWDVPLNDKQLFREKIRKLLYMDNTLFINKAEKIEDYIEKNALINNKEYLNEYTKMFLG